MVPEFALCVGGRLEDELCEARVRVHLLGAVRGSRPWTVLRARAALCRLLAVAGPFDAIVCHQPWTQGLFGGVVQKSGVPYVAYFHGPRDGGWPEYLARRHRPQLLIAPSRHALESMQTVFPGVPGEVLNYPLPAHVAATADLTAEQRLVVRSKLGARPGDVVILQASRIERWKGPDVVLRALGRLTDLPNWRFWLAGGVQRKKEVSYFDELRSIAVAAGISNRVQFLGQRSDVWVLMRASDLYCQGNRGPEGFGLSFLEASYCGLPIVTSALGGAPELIDPSTGILVAPENVEELAGALRALLTDAARREASGDRARTKAKEMCNTTRQLHLLSQLLARASGLHLARRRGDVHTAGD
jgi:glycosyltransferase involved in cell wall biosynthesis